MAVQKDLIEVEFQRLEQAWDHGNKFQPRVVPAIQGQFLYKVTSRDQGKGFSHAGLTSHQG